MKELSKDDSRSLATNSILSGNLSIKKTEIISILKRRNNSTENVGVGDPKHLNALNGVGSSSVNSQTFSEGSVQKFEEDDDESDSDWDGFPVKQNSKSK